MSGNEKYGYSELEKPQWKENISPKVENQDAWEIKDLSELESLANQEKGEVHKETNDALSWLMGDIETPSNINKQEDPDWAFGMHMLNEEIVYKDLETFA